MLTVKQHPVCFVPRPTCPLAWRDKPGRWSSWTSLGGKWLLGSTRLMRPWMR